MLTIVIVFKLTFQKIFFKLMHLNKLNDEVGGTKFVDSNTNMLILIYFLLVLLVNFKCHISHLLLKLNFVVISQDTIFQTCYASSSDIG